MSTYQQQAPTNQQPAGIATASVVLGAVGFVVGICSVIGLILGLVARGKAKRGEISPARVKTGIIVSTISLVLGLIGWIILIAALGAGTNTATTALSTAPAAPQASDTSASPSAETPAPVETKQAAPATTAAAPTTTEAAPVAPTTEAAPVVPTAAVADVTVAQKNAVRSAKDYLDYTAFSRSGLIKQLESEGFSTEDATYAVDSLTVDYNEQAAKSAKSYLDYTSFSRSSLIHQLEFEGYSASEAEYGASQSGL